MEHTKKNQPSKMVDERNRNRNDKTQNNPTRMNSNHKKMETHRDGRTGSDRKNRPSGSSDSL